MAYRVYGALLDSLMSDNPKLPTLRDVARKAGVSTATVSRCLNDPGKVVKDTRERVQAAVDALGYMPNFAARVMAARQSQTIGAIIPTMDNAIFARGLQSFQEELHHEGYTLLLSSTAYRPDIEEEQIRALVARGADGLLLIGQDRVPGIYDFLRQRNVPSILAWSYAPDTPVPCVGFDNRAAMRALAEAVIAQGHTRIGMIAGLSAGNDRARNRLQGARDAVRRAGLSQDALLVAETPYGVQEGMTVFRQFMADPAPPTAVMCGNDVLAVGALREAQRLGLRVPADVSVTGFDDLEFAHIVAPALTTVHVPHRAMGRAAARALVTMLRTQKPVSSVELDTTLQRRASLGPCPSERDNHRVAP
ncbi:MAG: LacI family DNA-binding transcriptional regulator [Pseudomonadota bacterium]